MPSKKNVDKWRLKNLKNLSHECNENDEVTFVYLDLSKVLLIGKLQWQS